MTDHHDFGDHHDFTDDPLPYDDGAPAVHDHGYAEEPWTDEPSGAFDLPAPDDHQPYADDLPDVTETPEVETPVAAADPVEVFPPALDVDLPEPVDGFPWIDTGSLGLVDAGLIDPADQPVSPDELAAYAETDLPPAADPWAALAGSDDPATAALARWWSDPDTGTGTGTGA
ncbi:MAG: hypothetical protein ABW022_25255 [Actinoplanes sp.]